MQKLKLQSTIYYLLSNRGFAVLFTVLISSIILAIALGITSISYQEVVLSSSAKEGSIAFYAADSGAECALYWDTQGVFDLASFIVPMCNGAKVTGSMFGFPPSSGTVYDFNIDLGSSCAKITVDKDYPTTQGGTKIESLGYNVSCTELGLNPSNPRIVERAIGVTYGVSSGGGGGACPDGTCDSSETALSCPADCSNFAQ